MSRSSVPSVSLTGEGLPGQDDKSVCSLCLVQFARYTCPRCNVQYCSLDCYKSEKHAQCSEDFYRESFMSELQSRTTSAAERSKMVEMLRRVEEESEEWTGQEKGEEEGLEERLAGVNLDAADPDTVWQKLTRSEQEQFQKAVVSGHLASLLPAYTPWWQRMKPVIVVDETVQSDCHTTPEVLADLPPLNSLVKDGKVSPIVRYSVLNVLYAYAYTVRLYNGDHHDLAVDAAQTVLDISSCLSDNASYPTAGEALTHAVTTVQQTQHLVSSSDMVFSVLKDVSCILSCPVLPSCCNVPRALSDLHHVFSSAVSQLLSQHGDYKTVKVANKKVYFLTVWSLQNTENLQCLTRVVDTEYETSISRWRDQTEQTHLKPQLNPSPTNSKLITEIS